MMDGNIFVVDFTGKNAALWNYKMVVMYVLTSIVIITDIVITAMYYGSGSLF